MEEFKKSLEINQENLKLIAETFNKVSPLFKMPSDIVYNTIINCFVKNKDRKLFYSEVLYALTFAELTPSDDKKLQDLKDQGKTYLERIDIIRNTDTFTPDYYGAKCKCGEKIDAYTICDKYSKPHKGSAWHHAVKKLIRAGDGHKPLLKDIDEVIDSLKRWKEQLNAK